MGRGVGIPFVVEMTLVGLIGCDTRGDSWNAVVALIFFVGGVVPATLANTVITAFWHRQGSWVLVGRGLLVAIIVPILVALVLRQ